MEWYYKATLGFFLLVIVLGILSILVFPGDFTPKNDCNVVSISLQDGPNGELPICYNGSDLMFYVKNIGTEDIPIVNLKLIITGSTGNPYELGSSFENVDGYNSIFEGSWKHIIVQPQIMGNEHIVDVLIIPVISHVKGDPKSDLKYCTKLPKNNIPGQVIQITEIPLCN